MTRGLINALTLSEIRRMAIEVESKVYNLRSTITSTRDVKDELLTEQWREVEIARGHMARIVPIPNEHRVSMCVVDVEPGASLEMHKHDTSEYVFVIRGLLRMDVVYHTKTDDGRVDDQTHTHIINPGQTLFIPSGLSHGGYEGYAPERSLLVVLFDNPMPLEYVLPVSR